MDSVCGCIAKDDNKMVVRLSPQAVRPDWAFFKGHLRSWHHIFLPKEPNF